jgi:RNA polymerase sigma factor for flagellar operon FliA
MSSTVTETRPAPVSALEQADAATLEAAADALLAAAERVASAAVAGRDEPEPDPDPATAPRPRPRRRAPENMTPEQAEARAEMINRNAALVRFVANSMARHIGQSVLLDYDDLLSYGTEGLIAAVDTFDTERGVQFSTWAVMQIRTTIQDALRKLDPMSRNLRLKSKEIDRVSSELAHATGCWPAQTEVADALGQPVEVLRRTMHELSRGSVSLEQVDGGHSGAATSGDEGGFSLLDIIADDDPEVSPAESLDRREMSRLVAEAVATLPSREQVLVDAHYRQGQSMRAIARMLSISESRVSQLHARAIRLMRENLDRALSLDPKPPTRRATPGRSGGPTPLRAQQRPQSLAERYGARAA